MKSAEQAPWPEHESLRLTQNGALGVAESDFRAAVDDALAAGLIYDPVRLSDGDLQCHWRLEVTPKGAASARGANL